MAKFDVQLVGKVGSMALVNQEYNDIDYNIIAQISHQLKPGMVWITSGATVVGRIDFIKRNGYELKGDINDIKTDYAAQGQAILMQTYRQFLSEKYSLRQILVEHSHFNDSARKEHLKRTLLRAIKQKAIPIINYNDPVSSEEIVKTELLNIKGENKITALDNDETASQIALLLKAKTLLILTSVDGIYKDKNDKNSLIKEISGKDIYELLENVEKCQENCSGASRSGANGARAKLEYIKEPLKLGTEVFIANSKYKIKDILDRKAPSTYISVK